MREDKIINKPLDIPFKEFMPGQVIQSVQFNDDMKDIEDKVNEIVDKHNLGINKLHDHLEDLNNPHNVTPHQIGTYTNEEIDEFIDDIKNGNLFDKSISNRVLDDECVDTRVIQDGSVTVSKVDPELGSQLNLENNISITSRYTKEETDTIIRERVGDGTYSREEIDSKFEEYQAGTIVDGTISVDKLKYDVGVKLDISANPSITDRYTKAEVNNLIQKNGLPKDWGGLGEVEEVTPITDYGYLPIADIMTADEFIAPLTPVLDIDVKENVDARGEYSSVGDRLNKSDEKQEELSSQLERVSNNITYINLNEFKHLVVDNDWTNALQHAIDKINPGLTSSDSETKGRGVIELPSGVIGIKSVMLKSNITLRGQGMYKTIIKPLLNDGSTMFTQTGCDWSSGDLMTNVSVEDLSISPNGHMWSNDIEKPNVNVFDFTSNLNLYCKNIAIDNINGCCFDLRTCMDSYFDNICVTFCGDNDYVLKLGSLNGDLSNAITFNMVHIENSPKMLVLNDSSRQNKFISCKFESTVGRGIQPTDSPIKINASLSNVFDGCIFATTLEDYPLIKVGNSSACDVFNSCTFASGSRDKGWIFDLNNPLNLSIIGCSCGEYGLGKFITNATNTIISGCTFFRCGIDNVFMHLKNNNIVKDNIFSNVNTNNYIINLHENNNISDNFFINSNNNCELINVTGNENVIKGCRYLRKSNNVTKFMNLAENVSGNVIDRNFIKENDILFNGDTRKWNMYNESYSNTINAIGSTTTGSIRNINGFVQFHDGTEFTYLPKQVEAAIASSASDVETLRTDFNNLLVKLVNSKVLK